MIVILELESGKAIYIDDGGITRDEAHEIIVSLTEIWGNDIEKEELKDRILMM